MPIGFYCKKFGARVTCIPSLLSLTESSSIRHMNFLHLLALGHHSSSVVTCRGVGVGMAHELLHRHQVNACIHEITGESTAHVAGGKISQTCFLSPFLENCIDGLVAQLVGQNRAAFTDTDKEHTQCVSAQV